MDDLNIIKDEDIQTINLDLNTPVADSSGTLGIELLADPKKTNKPDGYTSGEDSKPSSPKKEFNLFGNNNDIKLDDIKLDNVDLPDFPPSSGDVKSVSMPQFDNDPLLTKENTESTDGFKPIHTLSAGEIKNEKIDLIYKFKRLENQGIKTTMNYNMNSQLEDMRNEYIKLKKQREMENSIKFQRKMLMACITGIEFLNGKFDTFAVKLEGWSESMNEGINDYDEVFEELHEKYGGKTDIAPEIRLIMMVAGSAFMFHLTNTLFKTSLPGMDDILKQNPELMQQFAKAAVNTPKSQPQPSNGPPPMNPMGMMGGLMSGLMGGGGMMGGMMGGMPPPRQPPMPPKRSETKPSMKNADNIDNIIDGMNINPDNIDLDNISIVSSDNGGITLNL